MLQRKAQTETVRNITLVLSHTNSIFMKQAGLLFLSLFAMAAANAQNNNDTIAIKQLLAKEAATWRSGDIKAHAACWQIQPYSETTVSTPDGKSFVVPASVMANLTTNVGGKGGYAIASNFNFSIHGNDAWVSHDEVSTAADSTKSYSHELRILEKINGEWKLVAQSIHVYKP